MESVSTARLIASRLRHEWKLLLAVFVGVVVTSTLVAAAPIYTKALEQLAFNTAVDRSPPGSLTVRVNAPHLFLDELNGFGADVVVREKLDESLVEVNTGVERYNRLGPYATGFKYRSQENSESEPTLGTQGYVQFFTNLSSHVEFVDGQMSSDAIVHGDTGLVIEGVIGEDDGEYFNVATGDEIVIANSIDDESRITVRITGVLKPRDVDDPYWQRSASLLIAVPERRGVPKAVAFFVTEIALNEGIGGIYTGIQSPTMWFMQVDGAAVQEMTVDEIQDRLGVLKTDLAVNVDGATSTTGISAIIDDLNRRTFYASIPLLLLLTIMIATVLYYLTMMVSYLVRSRTPDVALMRSRGTSLPQLLRLLTLEGSVLIVVSTIAAPFLAMGLVALAGKLPYFEEITGGDLIPVRIGYLPFLVAGATGLLCLAMLVVPAALGARTGLIMHRLRSSRPPAVPLFQRYYLDAALIAVGGMIFWEYYLRGELVTGGLFSEVEINEALLFAPVLFLTAVALVFMRFFPLVIRYISGESATLIHLLTGASAVTLIGGLIVREVRDSNPDGWIVPTLIIVPFALVYAATSQVSRSIRLLAGLLIEGGFLALYFLVEPLQSDVLFVPAVALLAVPAAQVLFWGLQRLANAWPVWVSVALLNMARNPLQYSWLVLLIVIVTGLGILSTTVRGTLDRSLEDQILYDVGSDFRLTGIQFFQGQGSGPFTEQVSSIPGVRGVSGAWRSSGAMGTGQGGHRFAVLAVDSSSFGRVAWFRDDFSSSSLDELMASLQGPASTEAVLLPEGATRVQVWVNPVKKYRSVSLLFAIRDEDGLIKTTFAEEELGEPGWTLMSADIPSGLQPPLELVSIQIYEPGFGAIGSVGTMYLDDLQAEGPDGQARVLDDFEGPANWTPLVTSEVSSDSITTTTSQIVSGTQAAQFDFGKETNYGIRGIYRGRAGGNLPIIASSSFLEATETSIGDSFIVELGRRLTPVVITGEVSLFPTIPDQTGAGFVIADLRTLLDRLNLLSPTDTVELTEMFISAADQDRRSILQSLGRLQLVIQDTESRLAAAQLDPLANAGWKAMVILSVGIVIFTAAFGYIVYLLSFAQRSRTEMGFLQSMGISRRQIAGLLGVEHLLVAMFGLGLGTWAGYQMSQTMVSALAVGSRGEAIVPPFVLMTDWSIMGPLFAALVGIFVMALAVLNRGISRLKLSAIARLEPG